VCPDLLVHQGLNPKWVKVVAFDKVCGIDGGVEDLWRLVAEAAVLLDHCERILVHMKSVLGVDENSVRGASGDFFNKVKHTSVRLHQTSASVCREKLVWMVTVEQNFTISASEKRNW